MSRPPGTGGTTRQTLHVSADLRLDVTAPDGRSAHVVVRDDGGTVRLVVARAGDLRVLWASLPGGLRGVAGRGVRMVRDGTVPVPPWDQPVEVAVGSAVLLRRRGGRWSPGPRVAAPAASLLAGALVAVGLAVAAVGRLRRRSAGSETASGGL